MPKNAADLEFSNFKIKIMSTIIILIILMFIILYLLLKFCSCCEETLTPKYRQYGQKSKIVKSDLEQPSMNDQINIYSNNSLMSYNSKNWEINQDQGHGNLSMAVNELAESQDSQEMRNLKIRTSLTPGTRKSASSSQRSNYETKSSEESHCIIINENNNKNNYNNTTTTTSLGCSHNGRWTKFSQSSTKKPLQQSLSEDPTLLAIGNSASPLHSSQNSGHNSAHSDNSHSQMSTNCTIGSSTAKPKFIKKRKSFIRQDMIHCEANQGINRNRSGIGSMKGGADERFKNLKLKG